MSNLKLLIKYNRYKPNIIDYFVFFCLASSFLGLFSRNLPIRTGLVIVTFFSLTFLFIIASYPRILTTKLVMTLLIYGVFVVGLFQYTLWSYMNDWNQSGILWEYFFLMLSISIFVYYYYRKDYRGFAWISKWAYVFIIITLVTTNIALFFEPYIVRNAASSGIFDDYQRGLYNISGSMGYGYAQAVICLIPILIYQIRKKQGMVFHPRVLKLILLIIIITELRSQVFANLLISVFILLVSFLGKRKLRFSYIMLLVVVIFLLVIPNSFYANIFSYLSSYFGSDTEIHYKLNDFAIFIQSQEFDTSTGAGGRASRYPMLYEAFLANPLFGNSSYNSIYDIDVGGHLYFMNRLANWGITGFSFFIFLLFVIFKKLNSVFNNEFKFYYQVSFVSLILLGLTKNVGGSEPWLIIIVVIPGLYFLPLLQHTYQNIRPNKKYTRL